MCVVCVMYEQERLTKEEAIMAAQEKLLTEPELSSEDTEHLTDVIKLMLDLIDNEEYEEFTD